MSSWAGFQAAAPEFAASGRRLLQAGLGAVPIGFLASVSAEGVPHLAPVCPIFCGDHVYLSVGAGTPKRRDLADGGAYVLHAFLGENDEEFQIAGRAHEVRAPEERAAVHAAIPFAAFGRDDPIFRLDVARCLWGWWENVGKPDTRPLRRRWREGEA